MARILKVPRLSGTNHGWMEQSLYSRRVRYQVMHYQCCSDLLYAKTRTAVAAHRALAELRDLQADAIDASTEMARQVAAEIRDDVLPALARWGRRAAEENPHDSKNRLQGQWTSPAVILVVIHLPLA